MSDLSQYAFMAATAALGLALAAYLAGALLGLTSRSLSLADGGTLSTASLSGTSGFRAAAGRNGTILTVNAFIFLTVALGARTMASGYGPFSNMYEFSMAFAWGAIAVYLFFEFRYRARSLALLVVPVALGMLVYASTLPDDIQPLVPALQNSLLLTVHVAVAVIAYGAFTVAFAAAVLYLVQGQRGMSWLPSKGVLDEVGYSAVMLGFPLLALTIILGAVWAEIAWGSYWSWDPKETASLVTWLIYGAYLHARVMRGWRGDRSAMLLIIGFAATLFTYFGNYFLGGLHSYA